MVDTILILKAFSRVFHLLAAGFFIGQTLNLISDISCITPIEDTSSNLWFWLLAIATGLANMVILIIIKRPSKDAHKLWKHLLNAKLALTVILLKPVSAVIVGVFTSVNPDNIL